MFWGLTPALDLTKEYQKLTGKCLPSVEMNILLVGSTDCRHIIKTVAERYHHEKVHLNFYIIETGMEAVAKQLLLLYIAFQPQKSIGIDGKVKMFMELYGNTLIRPYTAKYLYNFAVDMIKMITDYEYLKTKMNFVNIDVKYSERDYLESLLKFWCSKEDFNIIDYWDKRLRHNLGMRYDSKLGAFDWDLHMRLHNIGANQICNQEYRSFRLNGIAFTWLESAVSLSNRTLVCVPIRNGASYLHYGYLGEMETGPFIAYGLECDDKEFLKCVNGQNSYRATDVTERNLRQLFHEIEHQSKYEHMRTNDMKLGCATIKQDKLIFDKKAPSMIRIETIQNCVDSQDFTVHFLSSGILNAMIYKEKYHNYFDMIYFANNCTKYIDKEVIKKIGKAEGILLVENQNFVVRNRKKDLEIFLKNVCEKIDGSSEFKMFEITDIEKDSYIKFAILK